MSEYKANSMLTPEQAKLFKELWKQTGLPPMNHISLQWNTWTVALWKKSEVGYLAESSHLVSELDNLWEEIAMASRKTTVRPFDAEYITPYGALVSADKNILNKLTKVGMTDMGQNRTGTDGSPESSNQTIRVAVGDDNTAETEDDTALGNQLAVKDWSEAIMVNQTEKYAGSFTYSDFGTNVTLREAGGKTNATDDILVFHVTHGDKPIQSVGDVIYTLQASVQHQNGVIV